MRTISLLAILPALLVAAACTQDTPRGDPLKGGDAAAPEPMRPDGLPAGHPPMLPQGHPPMTATPGSPAAQPAAITWKVPDPWKETPSASSMRLAQFDVPGTWTDGGNVQCVLFTPMGGGVQGNLDRWKGMVGGGKSEAKVTSTEQNGLKISRIEVRGSYAETMSKPPHSSDDALFVGVVIDAGLGELVYTVKFVGPASVIETERPNFDQFIASFRKK